MLVIFLFTIDIIQCVDIALNTVYSWKSVVVSGERVMPQGVRVSPTAPNLEEIYGVFS